MRTPITTIEAGNKAFQVTPSALSCIANKLGPVGPTPPKVERSTAQIWADDNRTIPVFLQHALTTYRGATLPAVGINFQHFEVKFTDKPTTGVGGETSVFLAIPVAAIHFYAMAPP